MSRPLLILGLIAVLAACFGATLANRGAGSGRPDSAQQGDLRAIDRSKVTPVPVLRAPPQTGVLAMDHARIITGFGPRHSGKVATPGWSQQLDYLQSELQRLGLTVKRDTWTDRRELITFTNLSATIPGKEPARIVLACHHDTKCTVGHSDPARNFHFVGANDGASAVALLLALIPALQARTNLATIELVFFDGEESLDWDWNDGARALFGSKRYVKLARERQLTAKEPRIVAMLLLDMVGRTDLHIQEELYSTAELRSLAWSAAVACGYQQSFFQRAEAASDDHRPFLEVGIPSLDLIDLNGNPHWHKATDTLDNMAASSLQKIADVVLTLLPLVEGAYLAQGTPQGLQKER